MPTYEYECDKCGYTFERVQPITAEPLKRCPKCKGKVRRLISGGAAVLFKGSGFYETDYKRKSSSSSSSSKHNNKSSSESSGGTKGEGRDG